MGECRAVLVCRSRLALFRAGLAALLAGAFVLPSCGGGNGSPTESTPTSGGQCSTTGQVTFVRDTLQNIYFWYQQLPNPDVAGFSSPEAYLEAVRYKPLDTSFSYIANKAESEAFFSESQFIGIGLGTQQTGSSELRISQVFPQSPASEAGLARGDFVLTINGRAVSDLLRTGEIDTIFGPSQVGVAVTMTWRTFDAGDTRSATMTKRAVTIPTVSLTTVYDVRRGPRVGYVFFRNFVSPSVAALDNAFRQLREEGVDELVLDLRYNGGGLVSVAQHLGGLIGGADTNGQVFMEFFHNDKNRSRDTTFRFELPAQAIGFSRLVVITTRGSASASEGVINGLRPFMPVTVVGDTTFGKPVGQYGYDFCDKTLFPVAFQTRNARGEGDYFAGIPADCAAGDDLDHELGDPDEASLSEALEFLRTGSCTSASSASRSAHHAREARIGKGQPKDGWRQLVGAY
jgi:carboxyl-terminal processing protease